MLSVVDIFEQLGKRLRTFGEDTASQQAMEQAMEHNAWFAEQDIRYALAALDEQMLDRAKIEPWLQGYPTPAHAPLRVGIIMAGNIPLVGFADLMCVIASGNIPCLKYSSTI